MFTAVDTKILNNDGTGLEGSHKERLSVNPLIMKLCRRLEAEHIAYCHWKSNDVIGRSATGENDLDLLIDRIDGPRFAELLSRLRFKQANVAAERRMPGVLNYFGYDVETDKLIHVHAHFQLILGHDMTKNYRLPIERPYIASAVQDIPFKMPAPEFEFVVFVIRMVLKHSTWDTILGHEGRLNKAEMREFTYLQKRANRTRVNEILKQHLAYIDIELFENCIQTLQPGCSFGRRVKAGQKLQTRLRANARRPMPLDIFLKIWRRGVSAIRRRISKSPSKYRLQCGGAMIALVGGDGAGKSTAAQALSEWLSKHFETTTIHMGKPRWSPTTITLRGILKIGNMLRLYPLETSVRETLQKKSLVSQGYPWLLREACRARDRYRTYVKARRLAANGTLVILDRFPVPQIRLMDGRLAERFMSQLLQGPQAELLLSPRRDSRLLKFLVDLEERYYQKVVLPELLIVLRVNPEVAVHRKADEDATTVRERSREISELNWDGTSAHVIDACKTKTEVLTELKNIVWSQL